MFSADLKTAAKAILTGRDVNRLQGHVSRASALCALALGCSALTRATFADPAAVVDAAPTFLEVANLAHYADLNSALSPPARAKPRVVFLGDSITEGWRDADPGYFAPTVSIDRIDRGISGQTSPQMLLRFQQDVVALHPAAVHIMAGTNDIAGNWGAMPLESTESTIAVMAELAHANGIRVIIASVPPARSFPWRPNLQPGPAVVRLNQWLRTYCRQHGDTYVDYYSALTDGALGIRPELASDGVHPTPAGYALMRPLTESAIRRALEVHGR